MYFFVDSPRQVKANLLSSLTHNCYLTRPHRKCWCAAVARQYRPTITRVRIRAGCHNLLLHEPLCGGKLHTAAALVPRELLLANARLR